MDLTFSYKLSNTQILEGISLDARRGQIVALTGPSGSGKSTLFKLLLGLHPLEKGDVYLDGRSISSQGIHAWRRMFAYVPQDPFLFSCSVLDNIVRAAGQTDLREVIEATKLARADVFIEELPDGYETRIGEGGIDLSGGQKQRIALARAFLRKAPILLFDEPTAGLDEESQYHIGQALAESARQRIVLLIAHHLSVGKWADEIVYPGRGRVLERGTYAELMDHGGAFKELFAAELNPLKEASRGSP